MCHAGGFRYLPGSGGQGQQYSIFTRPVLKNLQSLFAYHIEALVPSNPPSPHATRTPQKLNGNKDVQFFSVGTMGGRTLIIYMKRRGVSTIATLRILLTDRGRWIVYSECWSLSSNESRKKLKLPEVSDDLHLETRGQSGSASSE